MKAASMMLSSFFMIFSFFIFVFPVSHREAMIQL